MPTLELDHISVRFDGFTLGPLNIDVEPGVTAVLGPNGSGKSTLLRSVVGLVRGAHGRALWGDLDLMTRPLEGFRAMTYVSDEVTDLFEQLTMAEYWQLAAAMRNRSFGEDVQDLLENAVEYAERLHLSAWDTPIRRCSLGMRRKTQLIGALMCHPRLLLVDEPQHGLDFSSSQALRTIFSELASTGGSVLMSNHDLDSVARIASRVLVLRSGKVVGDRDLAGDGVGGHDIERYVTERLGS